MHQNNIHFSTPSPERKPKVKTKNAEIQTLKDPGLLYHWNLQGGPQAVIKPAYGLDFVDPTPIATHVVSPDALEGQ